MSADTRDRKGPTLSSVTDKRPIWRSLWRGVRTRCPRCGKGKLFIGFLRITDQCPKCAEPLYHHRADDAPPYITVALVGHGIVALILWMEIAYQPPLWVHMAIWLPLTVVAGLAMMRPVKGLVVGLQWAVKMHGFDPETSSDTATVKNGGSDQ